MVILMLLAVTIKTCGQEIYFTILHTNDEHSALIPHSPAVDYHRGLYDSTIGGMARLGGAINLIRSQKQDEEVLLFSAGDFLGGAPFAWLSLAGYAPELDIMQLLKYDAVCIGNHEFDYGEQGLYNYLKKAGYPEANAKTALLASNIALESDHILQGMGLKDTHLITMENGLTVGLFSLIGVHAVSVIVTVDDIIFLDQHRTAELMVEKLNQAGADIIIAISHSGVDEDIELARSVSGIDVIVGGHCHTALFEPIITRDTIIVQAGYHLSHLGVLELAYDLADNSLRIRNQEQPFLIELNDDITPCPLVTEVVDHYQNLLNKMVFDLTDGEFSDVMESVVSSDFILPRSPSLQETPFGNYLVDAMRFMGQLISEKPVDFAFQANGQIRGSIIPGQMPHAKGEVSFYDLAELASIGVGADNKPGTALVSFYLTGEEIYRVMEISVFLGQFIGNTHFLQISGGRFTYVPNRVIYFTVPFLDLPLPSTRAVIKAERFVGTGIQTLNDEDYLPLLRGDQNLYHVVSDMYLLEFLPLVGQLLPQLELVPKDEDEQALLDLTDAIIEVNEQEYKIWRALIDYSASHPLGEQGLPQIPSIYADTSQRINEQWRPSILAYPAAGLAALLLLLLIF